MLKRVNVAIPELEHSILREVSFIRREPIGKLLAECVRDSFGSARPPKRKLKRKKEIVYGKAS